MTWADEPSRIEIKARDTESIDASITMHFVSPGGERSRFTASAGFAAEPAASATAVFEVSGNGYDWVAKTTEIVDGVMTVELPEAENQIYTRLRIAGNAAEAGGQVATIDWIEVNGAAGK